MRRALALAATLALASGANALALSAEALADESDDFGMMGHQLAQAMWRMDPDSLPVSWLKFSHTVERTKVIGYPHVCLEGTQLDLGCKYGLEYEVSAVNIPASRVIFLNQSRWNAENSIRKKVTLAYHEYTDVATGGKDDGGEISFEFWSNLHDVLALTSVLSPPSPEEFEILPQDPPKVR